MGTQRTEVGGGEVGSRERMDERMITVNANYFTISKRIGVNSSFLGPTSQLEMPRTHSE